MQLALNGFALAVLRGYLLTVVCETPILLLGLSRRHTFKTGLLAGFLLSACSYPFVALLFPLWLEPETINYFLVSEIFAPLCECLVFWCLFCRAYPFDIKAQRRDFLTIIGANLFSFALGELLKQWGLLRF